MNIIYRLLCLLFVFFIANAYAGTNFYIKSNACNKDITITFTPVQDFWTGKVNSGCPFNGSTSTKDWSISAGDTPKKYFRTYSVSTTTPPNNPPYYCRYNVNCTPSNNCPNSTELNIGAPGTCAITIDKNCNFSQTCCDTANNC